MTIPIRSGSEVVAELPEITRDAMNELVGSMLWGHGLSREETVAALTHTARNMADADNWMASGTDNSPEPSQDRAVTIILSDKMMMLVSQAFGRPVEAINDAEVSSWLRRQLVDTAQAVKRS